MSDFSVLYQFYDLYNGADFKGFYDFYRKAVEKFGMCEPEIVLDVGCGTGVLSKYLSKDYQVIGVDISPEMLSVASSRISGTNGKVLLLNQDMRSLELYGTVQGALSFCDCFNYMSSFEDLKKAFSRIALFLEEGGIFVFDSSTFYRFENLLNKKAFVNESEYGMLIHQGRYSKAAKALNIKITVFHGNGKTYKKYTEEQTEYYYSEKQFIKAAEETGFELCGIYGDLKFSPPSDMDEKHYYVFRRKKWEI